MELRDKNNTMDGYQETLDFKNKSIVEDNQKIKELQNSNVQIYPISNEQVISNTLDGIYKDLYDIFLINYSMGKDIYVVYKSYIDVVNAMLDTQRIMYYTQFLNIISAGILFDAGSDIFLKFVDLIKKDTKYKCSKDYLIELLINYKIPEYGRKNKHFLFKKPYQTFEQIELLSKTNKIEAIMLLKKYLQKQWLPSNNTQSRGKTYHCGYWSFESGAMVKILNLDDTIIKDLNYYPYDMVHYK
ncbi:MAG: DUF1911 domain-containing protein [Prevotellaceae bacterium]|jgi:hypothetical protein|nr:DUF1911 domain-containing protein [Prevotellaceae bacterium]